jgi:hypothetical protein
MQLERQCRTRASAPATLWTADPIGKKGSESIVRSEEAAVEEEVEVADEDRSRWW